MPPEHATGSFQFQNFPGEHAPGAPSNLQGPPGQAPSATPLGYFFCYIHSVHGVWSNVTVEPIECIVFKKQNPFLWSPVHHFSPLLEGAAARIYGVISSTGYIHVAFNWRQFENILEDPPSVSVSKLSLMPQCLVEHPQVFWFSRRVLDSFFIYTL